MAVVVVAQVVHRTFHVRREVVDLAVGVEQFRVEEEWTAVELHPMGIAVAAEQ